LDNSTRTHGAGFEGDVKATAVQVPGSQPLSRTAQGNDFRVSRGVVIPLATIFPSGNEGIIGIHNDGTHWNFIRTTCVVGKGDRLLHPKLVFCLRWC
jgi:hypothetical protein